MSWRSPPSPPSTTPTRPTPILGDEQVQIDGVDVWVSYEPIGLVLAVMPWNFPVWQVMRFAIPTIAAGNGVLLKHSPNVTGSALAMQQLFVAAGLPEHLVTTLVIAEPDVPKVDRMADRRRPDRGRHPDRQQSGRRRSRRGRRAGVEAVRARAGGSDAFVVLDDADVARPPRRRSRPATTTPARAVCAPSVSSSRRRWPTSSPTCSSRASGAGRRRPHRPGDRGRAAGSGRPAGRAATAGARSRWPAGQCCSPVADLSTGRVLLPAHGAGQHRPGVPAFDEETFGPVAAIAVAADDDDAVRLANATPFGLSLSIWTADMGRGVRSRSRSPPARHLSTPSLPPTPGCRSAGPRSPATAVSSPRRDPRVHQHPHLLDRPGPISTDSITTTGSTHHHGGPPLGLGITFVVMITLRAPTCSSWGDVRTSVDEESRAESSQTGSAARSSRTPTTTPGSRC